MTILIICLIIFGIMALLMGIMFFMGAETTQGKIGVVVFFVILWLICAFGVWGTAMYNADQWNGGYCECGGQWQPFGVSESRYGTTTKYYYCPNCRTEIEL